MDFLDNLDENVSKHKKSQRVRSWYLYEQFKSLERNQLDATRKLKNRSYQDKILRQELSERKARRKIYEVTQSESGISSSHRTRESSSLEDSSVDFFDSFYKLADEIPMDNDSLTKLAVEDILDGSTQDESQVEKFYKEYNLDEPKTDRSATESVVSVVYAEEMDRAEILTEDAKNCTNNEENKMENVELNYDDVNEQMEYLDKMARLSEREQRSEKEDCVYIVKADKKLHKFVNTPENNIHIMWSKLVSFAYQIMELNHGNCYYDYGSQFLTAVLACDVLRRGINKMCDILQPYVCPIKFATDSVPSYKHVKRKKTHKYNPRIKHYPDHREYKRRNRLRKYMSENFWEDRPRLFDKLIDVKKYCRTSEPCPGHQKYPLDKRNPPKCSYCKIWPSLSSKQVLSCSECRNILNPMSRVSCYLNELMNELDEPLDIYDR